MGDPGATDFMGECNVDMALLNDACCENTCRDEHTEAYVCGEAGYDCLDPMGTNFLNYTNSDYAAIASGRNNRISENSPYSFIAGGAGNQIFKAMAGTVSGGQRNIILSKYGSIIGGFENEVKGRMGTIAGGSRNT